MTALSAAHKKCNIVHGNISDRAILLQMTADRVKGALAEFDYAAYANDSARVACRDLPELKIFQSIRSLESAEAPRLPLDDWESLLYLVIFLGIYGISDQQREEFIRQLPDEEELCTELWITGGSVGVARLKRSAMNSYNDFVDYILNQMPAGPLRDLAEAIHQALFLHPGCAGASRQAGDIARARAGFLAANPNAEFIPPRELIDRLVLREDFVQEIVAALEHVLEVHRAIAVEAEAAAAPAAAAAA
ncbi:hypothetical protein GGI21_001473 [Coemansia aciculifera]|nr:hypothetical protein GGI21_001473 [Coemansia aciculifera]